MNRRLLILLTGLLLAACSSTPPSGGESPEGDEVRIEGLVEGSRGDLLLAARRDLATFAEQGRRADLQDAAWSMEATLRAAGHALAEVRPVFDGLEERRAHFVVTEGPRYLAGPVAIEVSGPGKEEYTPPDRLLRYFPSPDETLFGGPPSFEITKIEAGATEVVRELLLAGYYDASAEVLRPDYPEGSGPVTTRVKVETGRRYRMHWNPPSGEMPAAVRALLPPAESVEGKPFHVRKPAEIAAEFRRKVLGLGYQGARIEAVASVEEKDASAAVSLKVDAGPLMVLRRISIQGLDRTSEDFVRTRFLLDPGEPISQDAVEDALDELYRTGLFRRIRVQVRPEEDETTDPRPADLVVEMEEAPARTLDFLLGYGSYETLRGGVRFRDRNLLGLGRVFESDLRASLKSASLDLGIEDTYTLGRNRKLNGLVGVGYRSEPSFDTQNFRFLVSATQFLDEENLLTLGYRLQFSSVSNVTAQLPEGETEGDATNAGLFLTWRHDSRDDILHPWEGWLADAGLFYSSPTLGADLDFFELSGGVARYFVLSSDAVEEGGREGHEANTVLALGARFTTREILNDDPTLPIQERLFLGGENTVRSFRESELGPADARGEPLGGLTALQAHAEIRQRLAGDLWGAAFYDVGVVNPGAFELDGPLGHGVGVGLRYDLGIGPARLDFGYNPGPLFAASRDWALHLSFGFSF